jgi:hypothetical protein
MKKLIISITVILITMISLARAQVKKIDNTQNNQNNETGVYRLFPTQNIWTFIKLNTRNGQMWQVQYNINDNNRFETNLSLAPLVNKDEETNGRFTLYPTQNIYNFILLDQLDGRVWQAQWSIDVDKRGIIPIQYK